MDRVRVMLWCTTCVPGMQLPLFAASAAGVFAERRLDVELVPPVAPRDMTLAGLSVRVGAVDAGEADVAVTGVSYLLAAQAEAGGRLGVRFVASLHQRSPVAGVVPAGSEATTPADLAGRPTAGHGLAWMVGEYQAALAHHGLQPGATVDADDGAYAARSLARGDVAVSPAWVDTLPSIGDSADAAFRTVPVAVDVYASGLVAADRVPTEVALRLAAGLGEGVALQHAHPELGVEAYHRRFPAASPDYLQRAWAMFAPNGPDADTAGMSGDRWAASAAFYASAYGLPLPAVDQLCRPELLDSPASGDRPPASGDRPPASGDRPPTVAAAQA